MRRIGLLSIVALTAAVLTLGARFLTVRETKDAAPNSATASSPATTQTMAEPKPQPRALPSEMRGIHVTMALASLEDKIDEYLGLTSEGLNTIELDIKDENGEVGFRRPVVSLAHETGAAKRFYNPYQVARQVHARGVYLVGRIVVFEDPVLSEHKPHYAIRTTNGGVWRTAGGLGWVNPYDQRVWKYVTDLGEAAAEAGFDEIQFDYVRFPTDGDISGAVFAGAGHKSRARTIADFLKYASSRLKPLGVRVSADVFGLSATRNMKIGQRPDRIARYLDAIYPMVYPSHFGPGEYNIDNPNAQPGRTVALALRDFDVALRGSETRLVPWLQDFSLGRTYTLADVRDQIQAARDAGAEGFLLWNAGGIYTRAALAGP
jgi:hypothetical protein